MIGLMGGTVGSIISIWISFGMNLSAQEGSPLSVIPLWLIGFAIVFPFSWALQQDITLPTRL